MTRFVERGYIPRTPINRTGPKLNTYRTRITVGQTKKRENPRDCFASAVGSAG